MRLEPSDKINLDIKINEILLDPYNPRFLDSEILTQGQIQKRIMDTSDAKELLNSLKLGIKWVNRIVVRSINTLTEEQLRDMQDIAGCKYIVVEGNNRLACLKDTRMDGYIDRNEPLPVLVAIKENEESQIAYESELRLTQGIANVMVVKQWKPIAKARHLHKLYKDKKVLNSSKSMHQIFKDISEELAVKLTEVKSAVIRYSLYEEISKESDTMKEEDWQYLEAFDTNETVRNLFGMKSKSIDFEWDSMEDFDEDEDILNKKELLNLIPDMISSARNEGIFSKPFRNIWRSLVNRFDGKPIEELKEEIKDVLDIGTEKSWITITNNTTNTKSEEEIWNEKLNEVLAQLNSFPSAADWAVGNAVVLTNILNKVNKHLKIING